MDVLVISALTATNSQHVLVKILVRLLTMRTIQELKQGEYSVASGSCTETVPSRAGGGKANYERSNSMIEICTDNRFYVIAKAKRALLDSTNIETSPDEMKVLDDFLFRCWQMGWLDKYEEQEHVNADKS